MYTTRVRVWFRCSTEFVRSIGYDRFRRVGFRVLFIGFNMIVFSICFVHTDMNVVFRANCLRNPLE